jgi:hypothetical protein
MCEYRQLKTLYDDKNQLESLIQIKTTGLHQNTNRTLCRTNLEHLKPFIALILCTKAFSIRMENYKVLLFQNLINSAWNLLLLNYNVA